MNCLLMDFGASRIKSAVFDSQKNLLFGLQDMVPAVPVIQQNGMFEVDPAELCKLFDKIVVQCTEHYPVDIIALCTEMHGFVLLDEHNNYLSNYISWQDERETFASEKMFPEFSAAFPAENYLNKTGMFISSSPVISLLHVLQQHRGKKIKIAGMPEILADIHGKTCNTAHISSAAGLGMWNLADEKMDEEIIAYVQQKCGCKLTFNRVVSTLECAGYYHDIPIYCGLGDLQCAVIGSGNDENTISVNLGTGSQVSWIGRHASGLECRPLYNGKMMQTITHIPSGRALNKFIGFLSELAPQRDFWSELKDLTFADIANANMTFDLSIFSGAYLYKNGGAICNIRENDFSVKNYLASLLKSYLDQYVKIIDSFSPDKNIKILLSGGIPGRLPVIASFISEKTGLEVKSSNVKEETLEGLKKIVQYAILKFEVTKDANS